MTSTLPLPERAQIAGEKEWYTVLVLVWEDALNDAENARSAGNAGSRWRNISGPSRGKTHEES